MKKNYILILGLLFSVVAGKAQQRVPVANFSQFQQFFNPALTGNEGTTFKSFYRDHWDTFEGAPRSIFVAGEVNLAEVLAKGSSKGKISHAVGASYFNDSYGNLENNKFNLSYSAGYQLNNTFRVRIGAGATYTNSRFVFDNEWLVFDEPEEMSFTTDDANKLGLNAGVALTSDNLYVGYAVADVVQDVVSSGTYFNAKDKMQHVVQAGYRRSVLPQLGLVVNGIFRYDEVQKESIEGQLKAVYNNTVWAGAGYRNNLAYTVNAGFRISAFKVGYSREIYTSDVNSMYKGGNEIILSYNFSSKFFGKKLTIW